MKPHFIFSSPCVFGPTLGLGYNTFETTDIWMDWTSTDDVSMNEFYSKHTAFAPENTPGLAQKPLRVTDVAQVRNMAGYGGG